MDWILISKSTQIKNAYVGFSYVLWEGNIPDWHHHGTNKKLKYAIFKQPYTSEEMKIQKLIEKPTRLDAIIEHPLIEQKMYEPMIKKVLKE